jgi:hypothetical protein
MKSLKGFRCKEFFVEQPVRQVGVTMKRKIEVMLVHCLEKGQESENFRRAMQLLDAAGPTFVPGISRNRPTRIAFQANIMQAAPLHELVAEIIAANGERYVSGDAIFDQADFLIHINFTVWGSWSEVGQSVVDAFESLRVNSIETWIQV